jgi:hypothetical protein
MEEDIKHVVAYNGFNYTLKTEYCTLKPFSNVKTVESGRSLTGKD